jgi:GNAT superfamily N-acetyltransferase
VIERLERGDVSRCMALAESVGWPAEPAKWSLLFEVGRGYGVRDDEGGLAAMVVIPAFEGASFVAMMVVAPDRQGRGLGGALLRHVMNAAHPPLMLYATSQGRPVYERLGFRAVDGVRKYIGTPSTTRATAGIRNARATDERALVDQDARAFGLRRDGLMRALIGRAERIVVDERGGFALRWFNGQLRVVGPVVASDQAAAIALIDAALEGCPDRARVDVPLGSPRVAAHVAALGLDEHEPAPLMTYPHAFLPGARDRYHAIALQAFG